MSNQEGVVRQVKASLTIIIVFTLAIAATVTAAAFVNTLWLWIVAGVVLLGGSLIVRNHYRIIVMGYRPYQLLEAYYQKTLADVSAENE